MRLSKDHFPRTLNGKKNKKTPFHVSMICSHTMMYGLREVGGMVRETQHGALDPEGP